MPYETIYIKSKYLILVEEKRKKSFDNANHHINIQAFASGAFPQALNDGEMAFVKPIL